MSAPGLVIDIGEVVLADTTGVHPAMLRRLIEARVHGALMEAGVAQVLDGDASAGMIATEVAATVLQSADVRGARAYGS